MPLERILKEQTIKTVFSRYKVTAKVGWRHLCHSFLNLFIESKKLYIKQEAYLVTKSSIMLRFLFNKTTNINKNNREHQTV